LGLEEKETDNKEYYLAWDIYKKSEFYGGKPLVAVIDGRMEVIVLDSEADKIYTQNMIDLGKKIDCYSNFIYEKPKLSGYRENNMILNHSSFNTSKFEIFSLATGVPRNFSTHRMSNNEYKRFINTFEYDKTPNPYLHLTSGNIRYRSVIQSKLENLESDNSIKNLNKIEEENTPVNNKPFIDKQVSEENQSPLAEYLLKNENLKEIIYEKFLNEEEKMFLKITGQKDFYMPKLKFRIIVKVKEPFLNGSDEESNFFQKIVSIENDTKQHFSDLLVYLHYIKDRMNFGDTSNQVIRNKLVCQMTGYDLDNAHITGPSQRFEQCRNISKININIA